jgi:hypothetical protein
VQLLVAKQAFTFHGILPAGRQENEQVRRRVLASDATFQRTNQIARHTNTRDNRYFHSWANGPRGGF